jgi:hypothetical protein
MEPIHNHIWGPALWTILHHATERIGIYGYKSRIRIPGDEPRIWVGLLKSLQYSLPCPLCKKHFNEYLSSNPIVFFTKENIRQWLFQLHSHINNRNDSPNTITLEELPDIYNSPFNFNKSYAIFVKQLVISLQKGISIRNDIAKTIRFLQELQRYYDFS